MKIIQIHLKANFTNTYLTWTDITWHTFIIFLCYWIIKMTYTLLILYILLNYKYATTYFYNLYYVTTFITYYLPTLLLLFTSHTRTYISDIYSLHTIPYTFLPYTQCALHTSLTYISLSHKFLTHITTIITSIIYLFWKTYYLLY